VTDRSPLAPLGLLCALAYVGWTQGADEPLPDKGGYSMADPTPRESMRELSADRPDKTDCPFTVDAGHFQIEMDFANLTYGGPTAEGGNVALRTFEVAPMNVKVGLLNNLDFQLVFTPYRWERTDDRDTGTLDRASGFDGITPRFKVRF
jgi:hypothetical protein